MIQIFLAIVKIFKIFDFRKEYGGSSTSSKYIGNLKFQKLTKKPYFHLPKIKVHLLWEALFFLGYKGQQDRHVHYKVYIKWRRQNKLKYT